MIVLLILFQVKHFVCDYLYQPPYMYLNKGKLGHLGGVAHALFHGLGTMAVLAFADIPFIVAVWLTSVEMLVHYFVDYAKMNLNKKLGWGPTTTDNFWRLLGFDQLLHQLTYVWIIWMVLEKV